MVNHMVYHSQHLDLTFSAAGPDLAAFSEVARAALPRAPFTLGGRVARGAQGFVLHGVKARAGDDAAEVDGLLDASVYREFTERESGAQQ